MHQRNFVTKKFSAARFRSNWILRKLSVMNVIQLIVFLAISGKIAARVTRSAGRVSLSIDQASYFVSIRSNSEHICGGALVTETHVVTAAHCLTMSDDTPYEHMTVVSGMDDNDNGGTYSTIAEFRVHDPIRTADNALHWPDIAVIKLSQSIMLTDNQDVIELPNAGPKYTNTAVLITLGIDDDPSEPSCLHGSFTIMLEAPVFTINGVTVSAPKEHGTLCGMSQLSTELGDGNEGSPLVYEDELVGIASFLECDDSRYRYYTDVFEYVDFIRNVTGLQKVL